MLSGELGEFPKVKLQRLKNLEIFASHDVENVPLQEGIYFVFKSIFIVVYLLFGQNFLLIITSWYYELWMR